ncbi:hypothetical protein TNCV_3708371 [Trichonephila clavipes]|nr:hypothetical protein TNCV_3708371 [Trichonephila clavipes]
MIGKSQWNNDRNWGTSEIRPILSELHCGNEAQILFFNTSYQLRKKKRIAKYCLKKTRYGVGKYYKVYTDSSRIDNRSAGGIFIRISDLDITIKQRNPDTCSVFRSEFIAINVERYAIKPYDFDFGELWNISVRLSTLQYLSD